MCREQPFDFTRKAPLPRLRKSIHKLCKLLKLKVAAAAAVAARAVLAVLRAVKTLVKNGKEKEHSKDTKTEKEGTPAVLPKALTITSPVVMSVCLMLLSQTQQIPMLIQRLIGLRLHRNPTTPALKNW